MNPRVTSLFAASLLVVVSGCALFRRAGTPVSEIPDTPAERRAAALFYSDLGPDTVDVSGYPPEQRRNYAVYARACSRCHTLARSINAPHVGRGWWEFYAARMRVRSKFQGDPLTKEELRAAVDFLEYDANARKAGRAAEFETLKMELRARFEKVLEERMERLQSEPQPSLNP